MDYGWNTVEEIAGEITRLARRVSGDTYRMLKLLAEFDLRQGYLEFGMQSSAHWLSWHCGVKLGTAQEKMRVARALRGLPKISAAMQDGDVSYCKVRAITRIATAESEEALLKVAEEGTVKELEERIQRTRHADARAELEQGNARHASRYVQEFVNEQGLRVVRAELSPEAGEVFHTALPRSGR